MKTISAGKGKRQMVLKAQGAIPSGEQTDTTIVAIGASAGGIEALSDLISHLVF
jgi:chemotaxis response regulator CheB